MGYRLGDSTATNVDFNYLAFLREVIDCAVVLLETEATLNVNLEKRQTRASEWSGMIRAVEELGIEATSVVDSIVKEQPKTPAGRCAAAIAKSIKDAVDSEIATAKASSTAAREEIDRDDQLVRTRAKTVIEKLLRAHDLPEADKVLEATWTGEGLKAKLRERTSFGVEAAIQLETSASEVLVADLRVDRIADNVEVHTREAGGWLKKGDKLVAQRLGRYQVVSIRVGKDHVAFQLKSTDASSTTLSVTVPRTGEIEIAGSAPGKEFALEDRDRTGIKLLADKLEAAMRELEQQRTTLVALAIDDKPFTEHPHPCVLAERIVLAIAPTVQAIARHSRSPGELVLRRQLADDRREEVFIPVSELVKRIETLPVSARGVFAPLQLSGEAVPEPPKAIVDTRPEPVPIVKPPQPTARGSSSIPPRDIPRTVPPMPPPSGPNPTAADEVKLAASIDAALDDDAAEADAPPPK